MRVSRGNRNGFALAISMVAIVVIGALIAGAFFTSLQDFRMARNAIVQERALSAAEYGQNAVLTSWNASWASMKPGDTISWTHTLAGGGSARVRMTKLNNVTYSVVSEGIAGTNPGGEARRRTNAVLRTLTPNLKIHGAVTAAGPISFTGNIPANGINGNDAIPTGWGECGGTGANKAAISNDDPATEVTTGGNCGSTPSTSPCFAGSSRLNTDPTAGQLATYTDWGPFNWDSLANKADAAHTILATGVWGAPSPTLAGIQPSASGGTCTTGAMTTTAPIFGKNWGEPWRVSGNVPECQNYFPVIHITGSPTSTILINGVRGQGVLLVEGNLRIAGGFEFYGLVLVKGQFSLSGNPASQSRIIGAVMTGSPTGGSAMSGNATIQYSSCAVLQALAHATPRPVIAPERGWAEMY